MTRTPGYDRPAHPRRRAFHEAGHAVMAVMNGYPLVFVDIVIVDGERGGYTLAGHREGEKRLDYLPRVLGGLAAEQLRYGPRIHGAGAADDLCCAAQEWGAGLGFEQHVEHLSQWLDVTRQRLAIPRTWSRVEKLAELLVQRQRVEGREVHELVWDAELPERNPPHPEPPSRARLELVWLWASWEFHQRLRPKLGPKARNLADLGDVQGGRRKS